MRFIVASYVPIFSWMGLLSFEVCIKILSRAMGTSSPSGITFIDEGYPAEVSSHFAHKSKVEKEKPINSIVGLRPTVTKAFNMISEGSHLGCQTLPPALCTTIPVLESRRNLQYGAHH